MVRYNPNDRKSHNSVMILAHTPKVKKVKGASSLRRAHERPRKQRPGRKLLPVYDGLNVNMDVVRRLHRPLDRLKRHVPVDIDLLGADCVPHGHNHAAFTGRVHLVYVMSRILLTDVNVGPIISLLEPLVGPGGALVLSPINDAVSQSLLEYYGAVPKVVSPDSWRLERRGNCIVVRFGCLKDVPDVDQGGVLSFPTCVECFCPPGIIYYHVYLQ